MRERTAVKQMNSPSRIVLVADLSHCVMQKSKIPK